VTENARLHNLLRSSFDSVLTGNEIRTDTIRQYSNDTLRRVTGTELRRYLYREAKVINNSMNRAVNYITIRRGRLQGIRPNMGVVGHG